MSKPVYKPVAGDPLPGQYDVFHHVYEGKAPKLYVCPEAPDIKGAFVHLTTEDGEEVWLSGPITIRARHVKDRR